MKNWIGILAAIIVLIATVIAYGSDWGDRDLPVVEKETIQKTLSFPNPSGTKGVKVDNVDGSIQVSGYDGPTVQLVVEKTTRARSKEDLQVAKKEVELKISEKGNAIELFVDGPFRCKDGSISHRGSRFDGYLVNFDFQLKVPRNSDLYLRTVNHGEIAIDNAEGKYDVENVNGGVKMKEVAGSGRVYALNGGVNVLFSRNPSAESYFGSLNGNVEVAFRPDLSADLRFKTFNGGAYTDFPVTALPNLTPVHERTNGKFVYKSNRFFGARVGAGGPELKFDAFNGDIRITKR
ncbi:MAG: hypothetical protein LAO31_22410 [Acidobacteriia bacterium]|nr:hypothetical protein [Terriglobia bacterium]